MSPKKNGLTPKKRGKIHKTTKKKHIKIEFFINSKIQKDYYKKIISANLNVIKLLNACRFVFF